ncbi:MAG: Ig-like domain-containing protein [Archangium sp.]|nr:Ig-like domain-containing protein [Archangium sp.]
MRSFIAFAFVLTACSPAFLSFSSDKLSAIANGTDVVTFTVSPPTNGEVAFSLTGTATLSATKVTPANGSATVTLTSTTPGMVTVTATQGNLTASTSVTFTAPTPGLRWTTSPANGQTQNLLRGLGNALPTVVVEENGQTLTSSTASITVSVTPGSCNAQIDSSSLTTVSAQQGTATFNGLRISTAATGCTLTASSSGLTAGVSTSFNIAP